MFEVTVTDEGFRIRETPVDPPVHKSFREEDEQDEDPGLSRTVVAVDGDELCGFVTASFEGG
ncbi:hypothetical protein [Streptomyces sp. NPDC018693]|uniref:hypothetical protein n=1 Tax=unclassified Streptomyces TaxID=2593676 RepID=UPI0037A2E06F